MVSDNDFAYLSYLENELVCKSPKKDVEKSKKIYYNKKTGQWSFPKNHYPKQYKEVALNVLLFFY